MSTASLKVVVQKPRKDGRYLLYVRVIKDKRIVYIKTDKIVGPDGLTASKELKDPFLRKWASARLDRYYDLLNRVDTECWSADQVAEYLRNGQEEISFSRFCNGFVDEMINDGRAKTARDYKAALKSMEGFANTEDLLFAQLTQSFLTNWIESLKRKTHRAKEKYPYLMRYVFYQAQRRLNDEEVGLVRVPGNPWQNVDIPKSDTPDQRSVDVEVLRRFFAYEVPESRYSHPIDELALDVCKMVFCLAGINTADLYEARAEDYHDGIICYNRQKVRKVRADKGYFEMRVPEMLKPLFEKYRARGDSGYLFDFRRRYPSSEDSFNINVNCGIDVICDSLGIERMSTYSFRHTWSTIAQSECGASLADVDFALNHANHRMARVYVKINYEPAWELNEKVIDFLFFTDRACRVKEIQREQSLDKISVQNMMRGEAYFMGRLQASMEGLGFRNKDQVIDAVMALVPDEMAGRTLQVKVMNKDKGTQQFYERKKLSPSS